jgi:predicted NBD/HSP70 family sugar kinase
MTIAIDIGGTKTLIAAVHNNHPIQKQKFPTPKKYNDFINVLISNVQQITSSPIDVIAIGCAGPMDRSNGLIIKSPNLGWANKPIKNDLKKVFSKAQIYLENDANLAALSEAHHLKNIHQKVLYVTFSTGVGTGFVDNGVLVPELLDSEGGHMIFEHNGQMMDWESFAAGRAIVQKYGKMASELNDPVAWKAITQNMAIGIIDQCALFPADTVIIGGGVGTYFNKFGKFLKKAVDELAKTSKVISVPNIIGAYNAEEAVMLGCIILANQNEQHR